MNHVLVIDALAECGVLSDALEAEHDAIDAMLRTLNKVMLAGAELSVVVRVADLMIDYCRSHFETEERFLRDNRDAGLPEHAVAHEQLLEQAQRIRASISAGNPQATLEAADLLEALRNHSDRFDNPAYQRILERPDSAEVDSKRGRESARLRRMAL